MSSSPKHTSLTPSFDTIHIQVFEAQNLKPVKKDGTIDAICTVSSTINKQIFKTRTFKKTTNPDFQAHFRIFSSETDGQLQVKVWQDEGFFSKNQLIGSLTLNLKEFSSGQEISGWYSLVGQDGEETGRIKVAIHFTEEQKYPFPKGKKLKDFYNLGSVIGKGTFSEVAQATDKETGKVVALKTIDKSAISKKELGYVSREIEILQRLDHPHVIKLYNVFQTFNHIYMILEYAQGGELFDAILRRGKFSELDAIVIIRQITVALQYVHENGVAHRDLKPENLLLANEDKPDTAFFIKIADFGLANTLQANKFATFCGTPDYAAPEIIGHLPYTFAVDIWSLGVITYILLCGYAPFRGDTPMTLFNKIQNADFSFPPEEWDSASPEAKDFIKRMLVVDPDQRASPEELLSHSWITGYQDKMEEKNMGSFNPKKFKEYRETYMKANRKGHH
jgi:serine/threonine protein kinase